MATITQQQRDDLLGQLAKIQSGVDKLAAKEKGGQVSPAGKVIPMRNEEQGTVGGMYGNEAAENVSNVHFNSSTSSVGVPTISRSQSANFAKQQGLQGIADDQFGGLTYEEAYRRANQLRSERTSQVSPGTSSVFNPQTISDFSRGVTDTRFKVDRVNQEPWDDTQSKKDQKTAILNGFTEQVAGMFKTPEEFSSMMQNPDFNRAVTEFQRLGGSVPDIQAKIAQPKAQPQLPQPNQFGVETGAQTLEQYLGNITTPAEQQALDSLIPEKKVYQDQIALEQSIPQEYLSLFFGSEEALGILEQNRNLADEQIKLLERKAQNEKDNADAQVQYILDRAEVDKNRELDMVEENRLAAKNYVTGALAKLGALKTTGAAITGLAKLEQRYQQQAQKIRTDYTFYVREKGLELNKAVRDIELNRDQGIWKVRSDLNADEETVLKEVFKLQKEADRKTLSIAQTYAQEYRNQKEKYVKEAKAEAEKYAKEMAKIAGEYDITAGEGEYILGKGVVSPTGKIQDIGLTPTQEREVQGAGIVGEDAIRFFASAPSGFKGWLTRKVQTGKQSKGISIGKLSQMFDEWEKEQEQKNASALLFSN